MKLFTADKDTLTAEERIRLYPNLFGTKALEKLKIYNLILKQKKDGITTSDKDIQKALDDLPLTPMNFMDWAKDTGMYNTKMKGINPTRIPNAMQRAALIEYGYDIPDANELYKKAQQASTTPVSVVDSAATEVGTAAGLGGMDLSSTPDSDAEKEAAQKVEELGIDSGVGGVVTIGGDTYSLGGGTVVDDSIQVPDMETIQERIIKENKLGQYKDGVWTGPGGTNYSLTGGGVVDTSVGRMSAAEAAATEVEGGTSIEEVGSTEIEKIIEDDKKDTQILRKEIAENLNLLHPTQDFSSLSADYPGIRTNPFTVAAKVIAPAVSSIILPRDEVKRDPSDPVYNLEGTEVGKVSAFIPAMEAGKGREIGAKYSKLPNYSTWENVSDEEKNAILTHPEIEMYGASTKSVAGLIKAKENVEDIDEQIGFLKGDVSKYNKPLKEGDHVRNYIESIESIPWFDTASTGDQKLQQLNKWKEDLKKNQAERKRASSIFGFVKFEVGPYEEELKGKISLAEKLGWGKLTKKKVTRKKDGLVATDPQEEAARKRLAMQLPLLEDKRKELANRFNTAQANVDASKPDKSKMTYRGSLASDLGVSNTSGAFIPSTMKPEPRVDATSSVITDQDTGMIDAEEQQKIYKTAVKTIIDKEGHGTEGEGHMYFDGENPTTSGDFNAEGSQNLVLAGGNNIYDTINSITNKGKREKELKEVAYGLFGKGKRSGTGLAARLGFGRNNKDEFLRYMNMPKKDHKAYYNTHEQRGAVKLSRLQRNYLTDYSMNNHLERLIEKYPYLNNIARYPKEMQLFIMDNAFNMGPNWLGKFTKMERHLKKWVKDGYKKSDLKLVMKEYKDSDHFRRKISKARALENWQRLDELLKIG